MQRGLAHNPQPHANKIPTPQPLAESVRFPESGPLSQLCYAALVEAGFPAGTLQAVCWGQQTLGQLWGGGRKGQLGTLVRCMSTTFKTWLAPPYLGTVARLFPGVRQMKKANKKTSPSIAGSVLFFLFCFGGSPDSAGLWLPYFHNENIK